MNISASDDIDDIPWKRFLEDGRYKDEVGVYMGAWMWPEELWRPSENSVMNSDLSCFNAPSREAIYKRVMQLSEGDGWVYDYEKFVEFDMSLRKAKAPGRSVSTPSKDVIQRRIDTRPPTIYKGSPKDSGEKLDMPKHNCAPAARIQKNAETRSYKRTGDTKSLIITE